MRIKKLITKDKLTRKKERRNFAVGLWIIVLSPILLVWVICMMIFWLIARLGEWVLNL